MICLCAKCYINLKKCRKQNLFVKYVDTERLDYFFSFPCDCVSTDEKLLGFSCCIHSGMIPKQCLSLHRKARVTDCRTSAITAQKSHFQMVAWLWLSFLMINITPAKHNLPWKFKQFATLYICTLLQQNLVARYRALGSQNLQIFTQYSRTRCSTVQHSKHSIIKVIDLKVL